MPTYEYECKKCGYRFEEFQKMSDDPLKKCPECNKDSLRRLIGSGAGIIFKGSGFYCTDYRNPSYTDSKKKEKSKPASGSGDSAKPVQSPTENKNAKPENKD